MAASFELEFVEEPSEDNTCPICSDVLKNPILTDCCGQHYCEECLNKWLRKSSNCPHCRARGFKYINYLPKKRQIDSMKIYCPNRSKGCNKVMPNSDSQQHLGKCLFVEVPCYKKCGQVLLRKDLQGHLSDKCSHREVGCIYCKKKGMYKNITSKKHFDECPSYPLPCPNSCGQKDIKRKDLNAHKQNCPLQTIKCPFSSFTSAGCGKFLRKDLEAHINSCIQIHIVRLQKDMTALQRNVSLLQKDMTALQRNVNLHVLQRNVNLHVLQKDMTTLQGNVQRVMTIWLRDVTLLQGDMKLLKKTTTAHFYAIWFSIVFLVVLLAYLVLTKNT